MTAPLGRFRMSLHGEAAAPRAHGHAPKTLERARGEHGGRELRGRRSSEEFIRTHIEGGERGVARAPGGEEGEIASGAERDRWLGPTLARRAEIKAAFVAFASEADGCLLPSAVGPAPMGLESNGNRSYNALSSGLGAPSFNLPFLAVDGLPLGVQYIGFPGGDEKAAAVCHWLTGKFFGG